MARIKLELPENFEFSTEIPVRITDINYGGHLGNDSVLSVLHESRVRFFNSLGYESEGDIEGVGIIMGDAAIVYKSQSYYGDILTVQVTATDFSRRSFDLFYLITEKVSKREIARAKTGIVCFDYDTLKTVSVPEAFKHRFTEK